ncbi:hypothetical protein PFISCL1PPCAC_23898, partial [Pristionchus fissidentatus]
KGPEGTELMKDLNRHLTEKKGKIVCRPCSVACDDIDKFYIHCQIHEHLRITSQSPLKFITALIGVHHREAYFRMNV